MRSSRGPEATEWRERLRAVARLRARELRLNGVPLAQTASAAGIAWALAHDALDHPRPFFAPIAATIVLGLSPGRRSRRAIEMVIGVAVGIVVGDLLIAAIGSGAPQIALVVLLAMTAAVLLGGGPLVASQAAGSAVLVAALPSSHAIPSRFVDALIGGSVGMIVLVAVPRNPLALVQRATRPLFAELAAVLDAVADALAARDARAAVQALARARATSDLGGRVRHALELADETVSLAPAYWRSRKDVERYTEAFPHIDYAVRNVRVLARAARAAIDAAADIPADLPVACRELAAGVRGLERVLDSGQGEIEAVEATLRAAGRATLVLGESPSIQVGLMVAQIRTTAVDLLRALGIGRTDAVEHVRAAARRLEAEGRAVATRGASLPQGDQAAGPTAG